MDIKTAIKIGENVLADDTNGLSEQLENALKTLLSTCQLLCDTSDEMLPKKETSLNWDLAVMGVAEQEFEKGEVGGYNLAREEDILWLTKKMMEIDIEGICEKVHKAYCKYHLENKGTEYWTKGDYNKLTEEGKEYDRRTVGAVINAIIQSFGLKNMEG